MKHLGPFSNFRFYAQILKFWKADHVSKGAARGTKISLNLPLPPPRYKESNTQLLNLSSNSIFHAQIWQIWKLACILKMAAHRVKRVHFRLFWGRKRVHTQLHGQIWKFWKLSHVLKTQVHRVKISSISTDWGRKSVYLQLLDLSSTFRFHAQI